VIPATFCLLCAVELPLLKNLDIFNSSLQLYVCEGCMIAVSWFMY